MHLLFQIFPPMLFIRVNPFIRYLRIFLFTRSICPYLNRHAPLLYPNKAHKIKYPGRSTRRQNIVSMSYGEICTYDDFRCIFTRLDASPTRLDATRRDVKRLKKSVAPHRRILLKILSYLDSISCLHKSV